MAKYEYEDLKVLLDNKDLSKVSIANKLEITRPTLDNWLVKYRRDNALILKYGIENSEYVLQLEKENKNLQEQIKVLEDKELENKDPNKTDHNVTNTIDMAWEKIFK